MPTTSLTTLLPIALAVGVGGFVGALARFATAAIASSTLGPAWPVGTLAANLLGCLLLGYLRPWALTASASAVLVAALTTGFCGAYTTFSTFAVESVELARTAGARFAAGYVAVSVIGGCALVWVGMRAGGAT